MGEALRPTVKFLSEETTRQVVEDARRVLEEVGVFVGLERAREVLVGAGARVDDGGRVRISSDLVDRALGTVPDRFEMWDREGEASVRVGGDAVGFAPGSAAIKVLDWETGRARPSTRADCVTISRLTEGLEGMTFQATAVCPTDAPVEEADRYRLAVALRHCRKPVVTGTFREESFPVMRDMLVAVRGSAEALREKPLAIFDCAPTAPLSWSALIAASLLDCAEHGIPAEMVGMPMTGATAPATLLGAVTQHAAEALSGIVLHQLARPGAPLCWGSCTSAFDMRHGVSPYGSIETVMLNAATVEVGKRLGLPTHTYMALSDSKCLDYQAGMESGYGALMAGLSGINVVSGAGLLDFVATQSFEKLVMDDQACRLAHRAVGGVGLEDETPVVDVIRAGVEATQFLKLRHTRQWYRREVSMPGPTVDRQSHDAWLAAGGTTAAVRAHQEVERLLATEGAPPLADDVVTELDRLVVA